MKIRQELLSEHKWHCLDGFLNFYETQIEANLSGSNSIFNNEIILYLWDDYWYGLFVLDQ